MNDFILHEHIEFTMVVKLKEIKHNAIQLRNLFDRQKSLHLLRIGIILILFFSVKISNAQTHKEITAKRGDGIYSVLRENNIPVSYVNEFIQINKNKLGKNNQLLIGVSYKLPVIDSESGTSEPEKAQATPSTSSGTGNIKRFSIFGSAYHDVEIENNDLKGAVYYLVSGHGGPDPGAVAKYNGKTLCEDEYAYDITLRLARELISYGATVYMITRDNNDGIRNGWYLTPDKDEKCYPNLTIPLNQNLRLRQRKDAVNLLYKKYKGKYQRLVVIHVDSRSRGEKIDVFFYHDKRSKSGQKLANNLRDTFDKKYNQHQPGRGYSGTVSARNLYMLKYSWPVATFIELGNINHERDLKRFIVEDNRQALANWLAEGMLVDFKNNQ